MRKKIRRYLKIYVISLLIGLLFEALMSNIWRYDMLTYFLGVPVVIVLSWGSLLSLGYFLVEKYEKKTKIPFWLDLLLLYIPMIIIIEAIGTNILHWQLNKIYPAIIGNFMKAPFRIYVAYYLIALFIYSKIFKKIK